MIEQMKELDSKFDVRPLRDVDSLKDGGIKVGDSCCRSVESTGGTSPKHQTGGVKHEVLNRPF